MVVIRFDDLQPDLTDDTVEEIQSRIQGMGMDFLADTRPLGGLFAGVPGGLGADVTITGMRAPAGK
jgi:hypothetical protein